MSTISFASEKNVQALRVTPAGSQLQPDQVSMEEPLEIKIGFGRGERQQESIAVTMRTPGQDVDLALGFLFTEGIIGGMTEVLSFRYLGDQMDEAAQENVLLIELQPGVQPDMDQLSRHFYTSSSCGVCGKASLDLVRTNICHFPIKNQPQVARQVLFELPNKLLQAQRAFEKTGGIHAVGLFDQQGGLLHVREDVGRHNAMDKVIGAALRGGLVPLRECLVLVSGRASFELVQKALMAGVPLLAAVGAPSSLAIELADENGMTLIGFLREGSFNVYCSVERVGA